MKSVGKILFYVLMIVLIVPSSNAFSSNKILNIRHWAAPDHTRIVFDTTDESRYKLEKKDTAVIIDFSDMVLSEGLPHEITLKKPEKSIVKLSILPDDHIRVEIAIPPNVNTNIFNLKRVQDKPDRLVIDLELLDVTKKEMEEREQVKVSGKTKVIVIDPGHGGEDPGAVGKKGTFEKDVVLNIGKYLRDILNRKRGYRAFMTRDGDYYVSFRKRTTIAREYGADLFISIHADAAASRYAKGTSVYCLSVKGASSEAAKILARNENLADLVGGSPNGESIEDSDAIVLNMFQTNTINASRIFGHSVLRNLDGICRLKFNAVQEAPFRVLKLPDIPSLLVETAYISNPQEEKLLRSRKYQKALADGIGKAIIEFLSRQPTTAPVIELVKQNEAQTTPAAEKAELEKIAKRDGDEAPVKTAHEEASLSAEPATYKKQREEGSEPAKKTLVETYKVKEGDSLDKIARRHGTTISALLRLNDMKLKDALYVGRRLKITASQTTEESAEESTKTAGKSRKQQKVKVVTYKIRYGDSLAKIAQAHNTTIGALLKENDMNLDDVLYAGRKLKVKIVQHREVAARSDRQDAKAKEEGRKAVGLYKVKYGDRLDRIARRHGMTLNEILNLNDMKLKDTLVTGRRIKVYERGSSQENVQETAGAPIEEAPAGQEIKTYKVKKGDNIDKIARRHGMTIPDLLELNRMKLDDTLYAGRSLKVKAQETVEEKAEQEQASDEKAAAESAPEELTYKVKKGDSLDRIARRHGTTLGALMKLNNIKLKEPLYAGRIIKIRGQPSAPAKAVERRSAAKEKSPSPSAGEKKFVKYKVKKGDSIDIIAKRHHVSSDAILTLNNMRRSDVLFYGRTIKVPQPAN